MSRFRLLVLITLVSASVAVARPPVERVTDVSTSHSAFGDMPRARTVFSVATPNTTLLYSATFDAGGTCSAQSWTVVDLSVEAGSFWHVDDYAGLPFGPLQGTKSLWCGARPQPSGSFCGYATLPGYGNDWDQAWCTNTCIPISGTLDISFWMRLDAELYYDPFTLETTTDCVGFDNWIWCGPPCGVRETWDSPQEAFITRSYPVTVSSLRVRLRFQSDFQYSDEDGLLDTYAGAVHIDDLTIEGLPIETFEDENSGDTAADDWVSCNPPGFGESYMALFPGSTLMQEDQCARNLSCVWAAINGSTESYFCYTPPLPQVALPDGNNRGQYLHTAIWSPPIPLAGAGAVTNLEFKVYRDLPLDAVVLYKWAVRSYSGGSCKGPWRSRGIFYFGDQKDWATVTHPVGDLLASNATFLEIALEIVDMCKYWCTAYMPPRCHTHAPLLDNVRLYRVDINGPRWSTRDIDMFQDTFPTDGTITGIGRADMARSITSPYTLTILPGDSVVFTCADPTTATVGNPSGLGSDPVLGGKQSYLYVHCSDPAKTGTVLTDSPSSYPFKDVVMAGEKSWTRIRCEQTPAPSGTQFRVDLNDALFEAGDIVEFFFGATNTNGETSYCSGSSLGYVQSDLDEAARNASEFTVLPVHEYSLLYVDGMDGRGSQQYWDGAFDQLGMLPWIDRYDVRGPTSSVANRPASRVTDIEQVGHYAAILWDCGDLSSTLGDGTGNPEKSNDYALIAAYIDQYPLDGGVYICGDDVANSLMNASGSSAVAFRSTYVPFTLTTGNHRPAYGVSPIIVGTPGGPFDRPAFAGDTFFASGACPLLNDFDAMTPTGFSQMQMSYGPPAVNNGAVISKKTPANTAFTAWVTVMLSGFSFSYIRDDESDGIMDRADHLSDILRFFIGVNWPPTGAEPLHTTRLAQNYPNPFNPVTTIAFSLRQRGRVRIDVFTVAGEHVRTLLDETRPAGAHTDIRWDGHDRNGRAVASGVYFYKLTTTGFEQTRKMVLLK